MKLLLILPLALLFGCSTPKKEDVIAGAEQYLLENLNEPFLILQAKSTFHEGNLNPNGFKIVAAPKRDQRELILFNADYIEGKLIPRGTPVEKLFRFAQQRLSLSQQLVERMRGAFPKSRSAVSPAVSPNKLYPGESWVEIELYLLPDDETHPELFNKLAKILSDFLPGLPFDSTRLEIGFIPTKAFTPRSDGLLERYFEHKSPAWKRLSQALYKVRISDIDPKSPPDTSTLRNALYVNWTATTIKKARITAQHWLADHLKQTTGRTQNIGLNDVGIEIADPYNHLIFEFASCEKKKHPKNCSEEEKRVFRVLHRLVSGECSILP